MATAPSAFTSHTIDNDGIRIHCQAAGPSTGPLVLLLHGFPACWATWRAPMLALAEAGFLAVAPDLRGYGDSDKPAGVAAYSVTQLVADVAAIVRSFGRRQALFVGHDFGGGVALATAMLRPEIVSRLVTLNSVHPVSFERQIRKRSQLFKSWYLFFFQLPWLPEWLLARKGFRFVSRSLADDGLSPEVVADLVAGVRPPGALHAAINWFRASFRDGVKKRIVPTKVDVPTLVIWGDRERHLDPELAQPPPEWVTNARVVHVPEGSHWVHHDAPEKVAALLLEHFAASTSAARPAVDEAGHPA
jgi:pimeloyl-ACP methyl ester carboxylesterase